ncbi:MAG: hypothetical protein M0Z31_00595 [Clostridia bacterium]|nr:hypothetical protein [Clostridia bacterium]
MSLTKRVFTVLASIFIIIGVTGCMSEKEELVKYLEEKYGGKYEVVRYWTENTATSKLAHQMLVHPKGEPNILFKTGKYWSPTKQKEVFWDNYIQSKWSIDYTEEHKNKIISLDSRKMDVKFSIGVSGDPGSKFLNKTMGDYLKDKTGKEALPSGRIIVAIECDQEPDRKQEAELLFQMYKKIKNWGFDSYELNVIYVKTKYFKEAKELLGFMQADYMVPFEAFKRDSYYYFVYLLDDITTPEDILDEFRTGE